MSVLLMSLLIGQEVMVQSGPLQVAATINDITLVSQGRPAVCVTPRGSGVAGMISAADVLFAMQQGPEIDKAVEALLKAGRN